MKRIELRYVAATYPITSRLSEIYETDATTLRDVIGELDERYGGFDEMFIEPDSGRLTLNTMIYYGERNAVPKGVLDADLPVADGAVITFW